MKNKMLSYIESKYLNKNIPLFRSGYIIEVKIWITESTKKRLQSFIGTVLSVNKNGINSSFVLRKISHGIGVEKKFSLYSPIIYCIKIKKKIFFRKSKLYYLRFKNL